MRNDVTSNTLNHFVMGVGTSEDDFVIDGNGKIGIGTNVVSSSQLHVVGDIFASSHITSSGNISASGNILAANLAGATLTISEEVSISGNITASNVSASGLVIAATMSIGHGHGETNPEHALQVKGNISASGDIYGASAKLSAAGVTLVDAQALQFAGGIVVGSTGAKTIIEARDSSGINLNAPVTTSFNISSSGTITSATMSIGSATSSRHALEVYGNISASNRIFTHTLRIPQSADGSTSIFFGASGDNSNGTTNDNVARIYDDGNTLQLGYNDTEVISIKSGPDSDDGVNINRRLKLNGASSHLTASGNISSSKTITAMSMSIGPDGINPEHALQVKGNISASGNVYAKEVVINREDAGQPGLQIYHATENVLVQLESGDDQALIEFKDNGTTGGNNILAGGQGDDLILRSDAGNIVLKAGNTDETFRVNQNANITASGNYSGSGFIRAMHYKTAVAERTAAGSDQGGATTLTTTLASLAGNYFVDNDDANKGVIVYPVAQLPVGTTVTVHNISSVVVKVYPGSGDLIYPGSDQLKENKIKFEYETTVIPYIRPETKHTYTIDFTLPNGILIETKGRWVIEDRKKHLLIKKQHPELDIRMVFMSGKTKIRKGSKTTYGMFCDKHDILWAEKTIPESWLKEKKSS